MAVMQPDQATIETTNYGTLLLNVVELDQGWVAQVASENASSVPSPDLGSKTIAQSREAAIEQLRQALER